MSHFKEMTPVQGAEESTAYGAAEFTRDFKVSHETIHSLQRYALLLAEWQVRMNLVAPSTIPNIWLRHFADSAQLYDLLPQQTQNLVDIGSGAGFPGMVLAIIAQAKGRVLTIHLVESIQKKAQFLCALGEALDLPVIVHAKRTEAIKTLKADIVTARAVAALPDLFRYAQPFLKQGTVLLLSKGAQSEEELTKAKENWHFSCRMVQSKSDSSGKILRIENLQYKTGKSRDKTSKMAGRGQRPSGDK